MPKRTIPAFLLLFASILLTFAIAYDSQAALPSAPFALPQGFKMDVYATGLPTPRFLSFSPDGDLYVANFNSGRVAVLPDRDHDGKADDIIAFAGGFTSPNNVIFRGGAVYVGEFARIWRLQDTNGDLVADTRQAIISNLPADGRHRTKTIAFGPDGKLYINVGSFNDDGPEDPARATIWQYNADGTGGRVYAGGLRNTVGFAWDPTTGLMWGVDNGADDLGDNLPPDELNLLTDGADYGYPYCIGNRQRNPILPARDCSRTTPPTVTFPAHSAPLGMAFYSGPVYSFPSTYWGGLFVAQHSIQSRYAQRRAIVFVPFKDGRPAGPPIPFEATSETFLGLAVSPYDGSLFVSQDRSGTIYRISYTQPAPTPLPVTGPAPTAAPGKPRPRLDAQLPGPSRCFSQTGKCLRGAFLNYWFTHGGLEQFGLPVTNELVERLDDGKEYTVQYTERARFELHPENRGKESYVLLGRLGFDLAEGRGSEDPFKPLSPDANAQRAPGLLYFNATNHYIGREFQAYWERNGGIPVFGYPLSEAFQERSPTDGKTYLVQYFERNRLEYHPENQGTQYEVLLGLLGVQTYQNVYGARP